MGPFLKDLLPELNELKEETNIELFREGPPVQSSADALVIWNFENANARIRHKTEKTQRFETMYSPKSASRTVFHTIDRKSPKYRDAVTQAVPAANADALHTDPVQSMNEGMTIPKPSPKTNIPTVIIAPLSK